MTQIKPPDSLVANKNFKRSVFLAGSIEMGKAVDWQKDLADFFELQYVDVFNPRRDDWDNSWNTEFTSSQFNQQVNWELNGMDKADMIVMYLAPETISPISLLELGLYADTGKISVICPKEFARRGNVEIVCEKYGIPFYESIQDFKDKYTEITSVQTN